MLRGELRREDIAVLFRGHFGIFKVAEHADLDLAGVDGPDAWKDPLECFCPGRGLVTPSVSIESEEVVGETGRLDSDCSEGSLTVGVEDASAPWGVFAGEDTLSIGGVEDFQGGRDVGGRKD